MATLRAEPDLFPKAVDELLRYAGAAQLAIRRFTTEPVEIGGTVIPAHETIMVVLPSADRDPDRFVDPDLLNFARPDAHTSLAFGHGIHHCLGARLAHLEIEMALRTLLHRLPNLRLAVPIEQLHWREMFRGRGPVELPVTW
jgi:cytochrome P450